MKKNVAALMRKMADSLDPLRTSAKTDAICKLLEPVEPATPATFCKRLELLVDLTAKSRASFARAIGVGDTTLKNYIVGNTEPRVSELVQIWKITGVSLDWLFYGKGSMRSDA